MCTKESIVSKVVKFFTGTKSKRYTVDYSVGHGNIVFTGGVIEGIVYGGPYKKIPDSMQYVGVKMAEEVYHPHAIDCPTRDFSVPDVDTFRLALLQGAILLKKHGYLYVGCMGGIGRTGLYLAGMVELLHPAELIVKLGNTPTSIEYVRKNYKANAVETKEQIRFIETLPINDLRMIITKL